MWPWTVVALLGVNMCSLNQGCSHLQYVITCSMQIQKGKAWEIWSHVVMSGRQRVDTRGVVIIPVSCQTIPMREQQMVLMLPC